MDTEQIIWIIVAVVVLAVVLAIVAAMLRKRRTHAQREQATELRTQAESRVGDVRQSDLEAREAEAEAARVKAQAEQAELRAEELRRGQQHEEARVEDHTREADRIDPDVDHRH